MTEMMERAMADGAGSLVSDSEFIHSRRLANVVLDQPRRDPDDDLSTLARQLLRADERIARYAAALLSISLNTCCDTCREAALVARAALSPGEQDG